jgi:hypothetical protein
VKPATSAAVMIDVMKACMSTPPSLMCYPMTAKASGVMT